MIHLLYFVLVLLNTILLVASKGKFWWNAMAIGWICGLWCTIIMNK